LYVSFNDGESWQSLQNNLPHAPVYGLAIQPNFSDLVVATYGRGFWILDDITPLRTLSSAVVSKDLHLFPPRAAYRLHDAEQPFAVSYDASAGFSPPYGAPIDFYSRTGGDTATKDSVSLTISDASGALVRTIKAPRNAGIGRVWWNLRGDLTKQARLRTSPEYSPWFPVSLEGRDAPGVGRFGVLVAPGTYTVRISGTSESQTVVVKRDPNDAAPDGDLAQNVALSKQLTSDLDAAVGMINALENVRGQLYAMKATVGSDSTRKDVASAADSLDTKLLVVERKLFQTRTTGRGQDALRWPARLAEQMEYLAGQLSGSDYAPTESQRQVAALLRDQLQAVKAEFDRVMQQDVAAFNGMLQQRKVPNVIVSDR